jgi:hypothetical protein
LFKIGDENRRQDFSPTPVREVLRLWWIERRLMRDYPMGQ